MAVQFRSLYITFICGLLLCHVQLGEGANGQGADGKSANGQGADSKSTGGQDVDGSSENNYDLCRDTKVSYILRGRLCGAFFDRMPTQRKKFAKFGICNLRKRTVMPRITFGFGGVPTPQS